MSIFSKIPKPALIGVGAAAAAAAAVAGVMLLKEDSYRQIKIYEIEGSATVTRDGRKTMEPYVNMMLQNKDEAVTAEESYVQLQLDEDKYILMEPSSKIQIEATGNSADSKTKINLVEGAIVNRIENPLSEESSYEITTPNSTMAVRGTVFRVEVSLDENGESHAVITVYEGKVTCNLISPDGTVSEEEVVLEEGQQITVRGNEELSEYLGNKETIKYEEFVDKVLSFIGREGEVKENTTPDITEAKEPEENKTPAEPPKTEEPEENKTPAEPPKTEEPEENKTPAEPPKSEEPEENKTSASTPGTDTSGGNTAPPSTPDTDTSGGNETSPSTPASYTVTFMYGDKVFATQTVTTGELPATPLLKPEQKGQWDPAAMKEPVTAEKKIAWESDASAN